MPGVNGKPLSLKGHVGRIECSFSVKDEPDEHGVFTGYASVFDIKDLDGEIVDKGAFKRSISQKGDGVPTLWQHDRTNPIGRSLELTEDGRGLLVKAQLILDVQQAKEAYALVKSRVIKGLSIGYRVVEDYWKDNIRHLKQLDLREFSLVTFPANTSAAIIGVKEAGGTSGPVLIEIQMGNEDAKTVAELATQAIAGITSALSISVEDLKKALDKPADNGKPAGGFEPSITIVSAEPRTGKEGEPQAREPQASQQTVQDDKGIVEKDGEPAGVVNFDQALADDQTRRDMQEERWRMESAFRRAADSAIDDEDLTNQERKQHVTESVGQYSHALEDWWHRYIDAMCKDPETDENGQPKPKPATGAGPAEGKPDGKADANTVANTHTEEPGLALRRRRRSLRRALESAQKAQVFLDEAVKGVAREYYTASGARYYQYDMNAPHPVGRGAVVTAAPGSVGGGKDSSSSGSPSQEPGKASGNLPPAKPKEGDSDDLLRSLAAATGTAAKLVKQA